MFKHIAKTIISHTTFFSVWNNNVSPSRRHIEIHIQIELHSYNRRKRNRQNTCFNSPFDVKSKIGKEKALLIFSFFVATSSGKFSTETLWNCHTHARHLLKPSIKTIVANIQRNFLTQQRKNIKGWPQRNVQLQKQRSVSQMPGEKYCLLGHSDNN